jgi:hypothetical protein
MTTNPSEPSMPCAFERSATHCLRGRVMTEKEKTYKTRIGGVLTDADIEEMPMRPSGATTSRF